MKLNIKTIEDITSFCRIVSHYEQIPMEIYKDESRFDPKSIIGMMGIKYDQDLVLVIDGNHETETIIKKKLSPYIV